MAKAKAKESKGLEEGQIAFITKKVKELGYKRAVGFYSGPDKVSDYGRQVARTLFPEDAAKLEAEQAAAKKARTAPVAVAEKSDEPATVKRKRKIDVDDVIDDEEDF